MGKSCLGSPTTTSVLGSRRKQACFMAVMTAVTGFKYRISTGMVTKKKELTPVSTPELVFSDQKMGSLVVVAESPNIGAVLWVRNFSPTIKTARKVSPHRIFFDPAHFTISCQLSIPFNDEPHDVGIRQPVGEVCPMLLLRAFLPPPNIHPLGILPPLVGLEVSRV
jgi:hypothetical protein